MDNQLANYFQGVDLDTNYIQGVDLDTNYFQGVDLDSAPGDPGMNIELLSPDSNGMGDGSTASVEDTSSDIDLDGDLGPGYKQCFVCGKWKKDDGNFKKHMNTHNRQVPCEAGSPGKKHCFKRFADNKARNRHYWVYHEAWAKENNIPIEKSFCEPCKTSFVRRDFLRRHINNFHSKEPDAKHEIVEGDGEEYAWVYRLKDT